MILVQSNQWKTHSVRQFGKGAKEKELSSRIQILTEDWNRVVAVPYIIYMPEIDRVLMLVNCDYASPPHVHYPMVLFSDDRGASWSPPRYVHTDNEGKPDIGMGIGLTYFGKGKVLLYADSLRWFSYDYGKTWGDAIPVQSAFGEKQWFQWDPALVEKDPATGKNKRLVETGYTMNYDAYKEATGDCSQGFIRFSVDEGRTWDDAIKVPQWQGINEIALVRAKNGTIVAACRTDLPDRFKKLRDDNYEGFGFSLSKDDGYTWSEVRILYEYGRHHPSLVLLADGEIVMTYVVRRGYPLAANGYEQFGVEAVVSRDNGETWDMENRYVLTNWVSNRPGEISNGVQATSSVLFPEGSILTAFGTIYRAQQVQPIEKGREHWMAPRDVGLICWQINECKTV